MNKENLDISVIIPTYNRSEKIPGILDVWRKVSDVTDCSFELIFSDDGSDDNTVSILKSCTDLPITLLENDHGGASSARNHAISNATGDRVIFVGDDIYPEPDFVKKHYEYGQKYGDNVAILGAVDWHPEQEKSYLLEHITEVGNEQFSFNRLKENSFTDFRHFYTCNVSLSRSMLNSVDIKFDERFYKVNFEDIELSYRLYNNGMKIIFMPDIFGYHYHEYEAERFCHRQATAGEMAVVFHELHPEIDSMLGITSTCNDYLEYKQSADDNIVSSIEFSISDVLGVCNGLEVELRSKLNCHCNELIKRLLSILYENLFRLKFAEGVLTKKYSSEVESINKYLLEKYFDLPFKKALLAEYSYSLIRKKRAIVLLYCMVFGISGLKGEKCGKMDKILQPVLSKDFINSNLGLKFIVKNRFIDYLKKFYILRQLKYKYDWVRRRLHNK